MEQQPSGRPFPPIDRAEASAAQAPLATVAQTQDAQPTAAQGRHARLLIGGVLAAALVLGWCGGFGAHWALEDAGRPEERTDALDTKALVEQIIKVVSDGQSRSEK
jgi:hypothetical protein